MAAAVQRPPRALPCWQTTRCPRKFRLSRWIQLPKNVGRIKPVAQFKLTHPVRAATDAATDYSKAETRKYVEEHALEQFANLESVLNALSQTNYADEIGNGPYKAMVAFQDDEQGNSKKSLEAWVVQSDEMTDDSGTAICGRAPGSKNRMSKALS